MSSPKIFPTDFTHLSGSLTGSGFVYIDDGTSNGWVTVDELHALLTSGQVTTALGFTPVNASTVGVANGIAQLDSGGHVPVAQISLVLNNLTNVNAPTPSGGQVLKWDSGTSKWIPLTLPTYPTALSGDSDVVITTPISGQYLEYNGSNWINAALPTIPTTIGTLTDVNMTTGPSDTDVLSFDTASGKWIPASRPSSGTPGSVWRTGSVVPSSTLGLNTDLYLRTSNGDVYQRSSGTYSVVTNITGPTGTMASIVDGNLVANTSGSTAVPIATTVSALLDYAMSSVQGRVLFRGVSGWTTLPAGTSGQVLATGGTAADPAWQNASAGGVVNVSGSGGLAGTITTTGSLTLASIATGNLLANTSGSSGLPVATTPSALLDNAISSTQGSIAYRNATGWVVLAVGTSGQVLTTGGAAANPSWVTPLVIPAAGYVYSNGTVLSTGTIGNGLTLTAGNLSVAAIAAGFVYSNGTILTAGTIGVGLTLVAGTLSQVAQPYEPKFGFGTAPVASQFIFGDFATRAVSYPANFSGSVFRCNTAATSSWTAIIKKNGTQVGTIVVAAAGTSGTFSTTGGTAVTLASTDYLEIVCPSVADATIAQGYGTLVGTR